MLTSLAVLDNHTMQAQVDTTDTIIHDKTLFMINISAIVSFELMLKIFYMCVQCIKLPDLSMAAEYPASIFPILHFECAVGWVR